jgi:hypothetical protein
MLCLRPFRRCQLPLTDRWFATPILGDGWEARAGQGSSSILTSVPWGSTAAPPRPAVTAGWRGKAIRPWVTQVVTPTTAALPGTAVRTAAVWSGPFPYRPPTSVTSWTRPCDARATERRFIAALLTCPQLAHVSLFVAGVEPANTGSVSCLLKNGFHPLDPTPDWEGTVYHVKGKLPA